MLVRFKDHVVTGVMVDTNSDDNPHWLLITPAESASVGSSPDMDVVSGRPKPIAIASSACREG